MQALVFDPVLPRLLAAGAASRLHPLGALRIAPPLRLREVEPPQLPGPDWARLRPVVTGICGSDLRQALLQASADNPLSGLVSFPHVLGHETVARVVEAGAKAAGLAVGELVAVDPWLGCLARGWGDLCPACRVGFPPHCVHVHQPGPDGRGGGPGMHLGNVRGLPGGFAEEMVAHRSQCHPLPHGVGADAAVLADPVAVALHAVARAGEPRGGPTLVLGAGTVGLAVTAVLRRAEPDTTCLVTAAWPHLHHAVERLGARPLPTAPAAVVAACAAATGARLVSPWRGPAWLLGAGCGRVIDTIGTASTMETALRCLAPHGRIVVVGVGRPRRTETTLTYYKEAEIVGSNGYGRLGPGPAHALTRALEVIAGLGGEAAAWHTHRFPLAAWRTAFRAAADPRRSGAIKVTLWPGGVRS
ncbi:MAG TPA: zinc-binding dehydrogenase [Candidatus Micrarchaeia archaeon]|nr:zinc-binding dehydrogenase [Candidatus Micrarchaeia archaeon]